jgi:hypothetical protein
LQLITATHQTEVEAQDNLSFQTEADTILGVILDRDSKILHTAMIHSIKLRVGPNKLLGFYSSPFSAAVILHYFTMQTQCAMPNQLNRSIIAHILHQISHLSATKYLQTHPTNANYKRFMSHLSKPWTQLSPPDNVLACIPDLSLDLIPSLETTHGTSQFSDIYTTIRIESHFRTFTQDYKTEADMLEFGNSRTQSSSLHLHMTQPLLLVIMDRTAMMHKDLIHAKGFAPWMCNNFNPEDPTHCKPLAFLTGHPCYKRSSDTHPNSKMNLITLAGKLTHVSTDEYPNLHYTPPINPCLPDLSTIDNDNNESKADALVRHMDVLAKDLDMDPIYLCYNACVIMEINGYLIPPSQHSPFSPALHHYWRLQQNHEQAERLAKAAEKRKALLAHLADLESRNKEEALCINARCAESFTFYFPKGKGPPYQSETPQGCLDAERLCPTCKKYLCTVCNSIICTMPAELEKTICTKCNHKLMETCTKCNKALEDCDEHQLLLCRSCYSLQCCETCLLYSQKLHNKHCSSPECNPCTICRKPMASLAEQMANICNDCLATLE